MARDVMSGGGGGGGPVIAFDRIGEEQEFFLAHQYYRDHLDFQTKKPELNDKGKPKQEVVITFIAGEGDMTTGKSGDRRPIATGEVVRAIMSKGGFSLWIKAIEKFREEHGRDPNTAERVRFRSEYAEIYINGKPASDDPITTNEMVAEILGKVPMTAQRSVAYRPSIKILPKNDDEMEERCDNLYDEVKARIAKLGTDADRSDEDEAPRGRQMDAPPAQWTDEEEPF